MTADLLAAWAAAEARLGRGAGPPDLPPRLRALWDALHTLDLGRPDAVAALADRLDPDHPDVAAVLRLVPADGGLDPAALPRIPETVELPFRDVLSLLDAARRGAPAVPTPRLDLASGYRPVLHSLVRLCTDERVDLYTNPIVAAFSPRADQVQVACRAVQITGCTARARLGAFLTPDGLVLDPDRWPDLDRPLTDGDVDVWSTTRIPWTDGLDAAVASLAAGDEAPIRHALAALLRRLVRDLRLGRLTGAARPVRAAWALAWRLDPTSDLTTQLALLQLRVDRYDPEAALPHPELLLHLWRDGDHLRPDARLVVARALLAELRHHLPPDVHREAVLHRVTHTPSSAEAGDVLLDHCLRWPPDVLLSGLARHGAAGLRKVHAAGVHAAGAGFLPQALGAARRLAAEPTPDDVAIGQILTLVVRAVHHTPDALDRVAAGLRDLLPARLPPGVWGPVALHRPLWERLGPDAHAAIARLPLRDLEPEDRAARLAADPAALRPFGRTLRGLSPDAAAALCLRTLACLHAWDPEDARALRTAPLTAWLAHDRAAAARARDALPTEGHLATGAVDWFLHAGQDAHDHAAWRARLTALLHVPPSHQAALESVAATLDLSSSRTLPAALAALRGALALHPAAPAPPPPGLDLPLRPPSPDRLTPPVHVTTDGHAVPDPWTTLGLPPGELDPDVVREAFREALLATPPEHDPRAAERAREARDRLLDPARLLDRELGVLHVPDPDAWGLPALSTSDLLPPEARLLAQLAIYTLVEEALWTEGLGATFQRAIEAARGAGADRG